VIPMTTPRMVSPQRSLFIRTVSNASLRLLEADRSLSPGRLLLCSASGAIRIAARRSDRDVTL
jgi:hypothetical protein